MKSSSGRRTSPPLVALLDYGMGNLHSAAKGLEVAGSEVLVTSSAVEARLAEAVVLPGVGHFGRCVDNLRRLGLDRFVIDWIGEGLPFMGICLGMQLLYEGSEEAEVEGLGVVPGVVKKLPATVEVPHMGWNTVEFEFGGNQETHSSSEPAGPGAESVRSLRTSGAWFYFVHSYAALTPPAGSDLVGWTFHGVRFVSMFVKGRLWATQFHPEKSSSTGLELLGKFASSLRRTFESGAQRES
jgi:glutamine amidotransferase